MQGRSPKYSLAFIFIWLVGYSTNHSHEPSHVRLSLSGRDLGVICRVHRPSPWCRDLLSTLEASLPCGAYWDCVYSNTHLYRLSCYVHWLRQYRIYVIYILPSIYSLAVSVWLSFSCSTAWSSRMSSMIRRISWVAWCSFPKKVLL